MIAPLILGAQSNYIAATGGAANESKHKQRLRNNFAKIDSIFNSIYTIKYDLNTIAKDDSLFQSTLNIIESESKEAYTLRGDVVLFMYWSGYLDGSVEFMSNGYIDYKHLGHMLESNKKVMRRYKQFTKQINRAK